MIIQRQFFAISMFKILGLAMTVSLLCAASARAADKSEAEYRTQLAGLSFPGLLVYRGVNKALAVAACSAGMVKIAAVGVVEAPVEKITKVLKAESLDCQTAIKKITMTEDEIRLRVTSTTKSVIKVIENMDPKQLRASSEELPATASTGKLAAE